MDVHNRFDLALPHTLVEGMPIGVVAADSERILYANPTASRLFAFDPPEAILSSSLPALFSIEDHDRLQRTIDAALNGGHDSESIELLGIGVNGTTVELDVHFSAVEHLGVRVIVAAMSDISQRRYSTRSLKRLAFRDLLTGLPNRALFLDRMSQALHRCKRSNGRFALMFLDLDGFKEVNDNYGHQYGDAALKQVAQRLLHVVREADTVARLGGDEFTIIVHDVHHDTGVVGVAHKVHSALQQPCSIGVAQVKLGASIGIAIYPDHGRDMHALILAADSAMYASKKNGKGLSSFFTPGLEESMRGPALYVEWSGEMEYGVRFMDEQHRGLVNQVNRIISALSAAEDGPEVDHQLDELIRATKVHFATEESHMDVLTAEDAARHRQQHVRLLDELMRIRATFETQGMSQTVQWVRDWLLVHIRHADPLLAEALRSQGYA
jgi:diguanylate cyclase (GGDEF)-like protein/hemerythrin-like metal-binding protein/PAS domain S-box-containing protein